MSSRPKVATRRVNKQPRKAAQQIMMPRVHARESKTNKFYMFVYKMENGQRRRLNLCNGVYNYGTTRCPDAFNSRSKCPRGKKCPYTHNVFEILYHPLVYKTRRCDKSKLSCRAGRDCVYAHSDDELRVLKSILGLNWRSANPVNERPAAIESKPKRKRVRLMIASSSPSARSSGAVTGSVGPLSVESMPSRTGTPQSVMTVEAMSISPTVEEAGDSVTQTEPEAVEVMELNEKIGKFEEWFGSVYDCNEPTGTYAEYLRRFVSLNLDDMDFLWRFYSSERAKFLDVLRKEIGWRGEHSRELFGKLLYQYHMPMDVCEWMERVVNLPQHRNLFERFGTCDLLARVGFDEDDLVEMGVSSRGHRIKIMFHLRELAKDFGC